MLISSKQVKDISSRIEENSTDIYCSGLFLSARWFVLSALNEKKDLNVVVLPNQEAAEYCSSDLYSLIEGDKVFFLPSSGKNIERSNYKSSLGVQRTAAINAMMERREKGTVIVTYPDALEEKVPDPKEVEGVNLSLKPGDTISFADIKEKLSEIGFERVDFVGSPGQYAIRGSLVDIFSYSSNNPYRISFFGDEIEGINEFDTNTQLSKGEIESIDIISDVYIDGEHQSVGITSLLGDDVLFWLDSSDMYKDREFFKEIERFRKVFIDTPLGKSIEDTVSFAISPQPVFNKNFDILASDIRSKIENRYKVYIYGEKESQLERLKSIILQEGGIIPETVPGKNIHAGFVDAQDKICCYSDHEIFDRFQRVRIRRTVEKSEQLTVNDLSAFNIGDYIVHIDHGVGIFGGLVRMRDDMGRMKEVVKLTYKDGDVVLVSVHALNKISRYRSSEGETPKINKLGSKSWQTLKLTAKRKVKDIAKDLIKLYAERKAAKGFAFSPDSYLQQELESSFIYEDTPDQEAATLAVKRDMEDECPMDRLVCGDVGFGKTEIAVRAAFKAVADSKQVVVLVPTTILALQHYNTFKSRIGNLPCNIEYVSRLRTAKELNDIKKRLAEGRVDILIGTHKVLGAEFKFKDLGLLIIDEEQKFGVAAKEKLRQLKQSIDTLTLTATPIPRTLQFSLLGARDLSIMNTPPPNRIPVQTEIILFNEEEIRSIINYELNRGGQVFFLHNRVDELQSIHDILQRIVPDMKICVAHGKMEAKELENKMLDFIRGDYDMLLCTTIVENGLDIPNANTIIINQAQNIGLSDLHQLRGRVGRSNKRAFCYLVVPPLVSITDDARKRLKAIEEFSDLGSGFNIAMQDLDIRGAGNLLGAEQSGFIMDMGYETYQKIIAEAMDELGFESGFTTDTMREKFMVDCTVETDQVAIIPDDYMDITSEKIRIYKQLDSFTSEKDIERFKSQMIDRFGSFPEEVANLFEVVKIRNMGGSLGFEKVIFKNNMLICFFVSNRMSSFYKSDALDRMIPKVTQITGLNFTQNDKGQLKLVAKGVDSLGKVVSILNKLQ